MQISLLTFRSRARLLMIVVTVILFIAVLLVIPRSEPKRRFQGSLEDMLPRDQEMPGWRLERRPLAETPELQKTIADNLHFDEAVYAILTGTGTRVSIYAAYWTPGRMPYRLIAGHTPDVCWVGNGWVIQERSVVTVPIREGDGASALQMERRIFNQNGMTEHVIFCHLVGGRTVSYGTGGQPPWFAMFTDLADNQSQLRGEQIFIRISSNRPYEEFFNTAPVRIFLQRVLLEATKISLATGGQT